MSFFLNPRRKRGGTRRERFKRVLTLPFVVFGLACGFTNIEYSYVHGDPTRLHLGERVSTMNTLFNTNSGKIVIGDDTIFGHGCMVITGVHRFYNGRRAKLQPDSPYRETPEDGIDIVIGPGCFIGSGAVILGGVTIGHDTIIGAGSVVTKDVPPSSFAVGIPARVIRSHGEEASGGVEERVGRYA